MNIKLIHDLSPMQLQTGFAQGVDGFFFGSLWYVNRKDTYEFVKDITMKGGLKKAWGLPSSAMYIHGSDRTLETKNTEKFRVFIRPAILNLREAVCFNPDVIQVLDVPLEDTDDEQRICEKLAINRDIVEESSNWLVKMRFRSSDRYKNGVFKFSKHMLLGVCHGDTPDVYAEEARFMMNYAEVIGVPIAGLLSKVQGLTMQQRYDYIVQVLTKVLDVVGNSRFVQLMGFGLSRMSELSRILGLVKKYDAAIWVESSTIIRNSTHARKLLCVNMESDEIEYANIARVQDADKMSAKEVFHENDMALKGVLNETLKRL